MRAEVLTVGSELTSGTTVNTNAAYLARRLAELGIACERQLTVGDHRAGLLRALREALDRCDLLLITGGLGPTFDDITIAAIAEVTRRPLAVVPTVASAIRRFYSDRHRHLQRAALRQASLPRGGQPLANPIGTAPGLWLPIGRKLIVAMPGVPAEMRAIMERHVLPRLKRLGGAQAIEGLTLRTAGIVELSIEAILRRLTIPEGVQVGLYPHLRMVDVRLTATAASKRSARQALVRLERPLRRALGVNVYGMDEETLEEVIGELLVKRRWSLAVAESCTGGLVCDRLTNAPGSSRYLRGGIVAYHDDVKRGPLGIPTTLLARHGAVSAPVARGMAEGVRRLLGSDVGLAVTGIAGPSGATPKKPVGLVHLAIAGPRGTLSRRHHFFGDRLSVKTQAAQTALDCLRRYLIPPSGTSAKTV